MAIGFDFYVMNEPALVNLVTLGSDFKLCEACWRNHEDIFCPRKFCKWRDMTYFEFVKKYRRK